MTRGNSVMWAPESTDSPTASASSCRTASATISGRLEQPGVDHLEPGVAQGPGDHLDAPVVAVEAGLGDDDSIRAQHARDTTGMSPVAPRRQRAARARSPWPSGACVVGARLWPSRLFVFAIPAITTHEPDGACSWARPTLRRRLGRRPGPATSPGPARSCCPTRPAASATSSCSTSDRRPDDRLARLRRPQGRPGPPVHAEVERRRRSLRRPVRRRRRSRPTGPGLVHYRVTVTKDGDVVIDLNPERRDRPDPAQRRHHHRRRPAPLHRPHHRLRAQG